VLLVTRKSVCAYVPRIVVLVWSKSSVSGRHLAAARGPGPRRAARRRRRKKTRRRKAAKSWPRGWREICDPRTGRKKPQAMGMAAPPRLLAADRPAISNSASDLPACCAFLRRSCGVRFSRPLQGLGVVPRVVRKYNAPTRPVRALVCPD